MKKQRVWPVVLVAVAGVAVTVFTVYLLASWPPDPPSSGATSRPAATAGASTESAGGPSEEVETAVLVVLGDEFSRTGGGGSGPAWPQLLGRDLGWEVAAVAQDDTGFLHADGGSRFRARIGTVVNHEPDVVIVGGGENDVARQPAEDIASAAADVVAEVVGGAPDAEVVLTSPFSKGKPGPLTAELTAALEQVAEDQGVGFVDVSEWLEDSGQVYDDDPKHPNEQGHQRIAQNMRDELARLGIG